MEKFEILTWYIKLYCMFNVYICDADVSNMC